MHTKTPVLFVSCICRVYAALNDYEKVFENINIAINIQLISLPPDHPLLAESYGTLALTLQSQDENKEALEYYEKALSIHLIHLPFNHSDVIGARQVIAVLELLLTLQQNERKGR